MKTLIVSPTYNESKNIADLIEHIFTLDKNYHY
jgi:glycosyltransferase involved in cell wall biosynthesis